MKLKNIRKILVIDDHPVTLKGIIEVIRDRYHDVEIFHTHKSKTGMNQLIRGKYDVLITDVSMPGIDGFDLASLAKKYNPSIKILIYSQYSEIWIIKKMLKKGVHAIVSKVNSEDDLKKAIKALDEDSTYFCKIVKESLLNSFSNTVDKPTNAFDIKITPREKEILQLIIEEKTTHQIAELLYISFNTVETYRKNLILKLNVKNTAGLVRKALEFNLV